MSEKVVQAIEIIETDEGFRIELKGDKEELRRMIFGGERGDHFNHHYARHFQRELRRGMRHGFGPFGHQHGHHGQPEFDPRGEHGFEPHGGRKRKGYDLGPWWDEDTTGEQA